LTPLPGTELFKEMRQNGRLLHEDFRKYTAADCVFKPANFTPEQLEQAYQALYQKVYSLKNIIYRNLFNRGILRNPSAYFFTLFGNLVYKKFINRGDAPNIL
jgi:hypothetical protein